MNVGLDRLQARVNTSLERGSHIIYANKETNKWCVHNWPKFSKMVVNNNLVISTNSQTVNEVHVVATVTLACYHLCQIFETVTVINARTVGISVTTKSFLNTRTKAKTNRSVIQWIVHTESHTI